MLGQGQYIDKGYGKFLLRESAARVLFYLGLGHISQMQAQMRDPNCKSPHLFFTVQWPDLPQHIPAHTGVPPENEREAYRIRMANLDEIPPIAASYFQKAGRFPLKKRLSFNCRL